MGFGVPCGVKPIAILGFFTAQLHPGDSAHESASPCSPSGALEGTELHRLRATREKTYPLVMTNVANWKDPPFLMGKSTISMAIFNSYFDITRG